MVRIKTYAVIVAKVREVVHSMIHIVSSVQRVSSCPSGLGLCQTLRNNYLGQNYHKIQYLPLAPKLDWVTIPDCALHVSVLLYALN